MTRKIGHRWQGSIELLETIRVVNENGFESPSMPPVQTPLTFDYVLVAKISDDENSHLVRKQKAFIETLKKKLNIHKFRDDDDNKVFYCIRAPEKIFETYRYLLKVSDACNWSCEQQGTIPQSTRIRIVDFILHHTHIDSEEGVSEYLPDLMKKNVFETHFCLHEKREQKELKQSWARWSACFRGQPITNVRNYLGENVALYFLWLGWYTFLLIPASVIGLVVFLYGLAFYSTSPLIKEVCQSNVIMCPLCDNTCRVWELSDTCMYAKVSLLFDNEGTVAFAMFMAVWATVFLEFWKCHRSSYVSAWKVFDWCEEEEELILEIVNNAHCEPKMHRHSYLRSTIVLVLVTLMLLVIIGLTHVLVVSRVIATVLLAENSTWQVITENSQTVAVMLGAVLHYITITVMTRVNFTVARKLSEIENKHSHAAVERSFTVKMFIFQFFTMFSSLIYTAFFLGRINGHPGGYVRISGKWRLEECHPSGCLTDLFIQLSIIMVLKQTFNNIFEYSGPWFSRWLKRKKAQKFRRRCVKCFKKEAMNTKEGSELCENCKLEDLHRNYSLIKTDRFSLFNEFLEMGVWTDVLEAIGVLAVIANGLVIGISSDFIPRLVYQYFYGPCASGSATGIDCMVGYINNTLSIANVSDERVREDFTSSQMVTYSGINVTHCSYRDYRSNEDFSLTNQYWVILAARLVFIILFEHVVVIFKCVASWFVPTSPLDVTNERLYDKLRRLKEELRVQRAQQDPLNEKLNGNGIEKRTSNQKKANKLNSM
ncbi:anoctamin-9-like isoform X2 [Cyprinus carpio]|uniref:Anoctamin n=1 Tax=Cyprinus carpio TaxID=7962 RepID=A0A9Q9VV05_CYPCA|nr:anoctamin-9-like isoform X2 [Cyprinus carpio]